MLEWQARMTAVVFQSAGFDLEELEGRVREGASRRLSRSL